MGAPTITWVDPDIAGNSGAGSEGDPYGDLQWALDQVTRDAVDGDIFRIVAGTDEILAAPLDLTTFGAVFTYVAPLIIEGATGSIAGGNQAGVDGNANHQLFAATTVDHVHVYNMRLQNSGASPIVHLDDSCVFLDCEITDATGIGLRLDSFAHVAGCYFHDLGNIGVLTRSCTIDGNFFANGAKSFTTAIIAREGTNVRRNIISIGGASNGIEVQSATSVCNNSILSPSGSGVGIGDETSIRAIYEMTGNVIEGFDSTGDGFNIVATSRIDLYGRNAVFLASDPYGSNAADIRNDLGDNETLSASPFQKDGSITFANRFAYFAPRNTGNLWSGAHTSGSNLDKGAVQHPPRTVVHPGTSGGANG